MHSTMIEQAEVIARKAHEGQTRWNGDPYITHPERIAKRLFNDGYPEEYIAVAWLHDVIEDTDVSIDDLEEFPRDVKIALMSLTHDKNDTYDMYIYHLKASRIALAVKLYDLSDNLSDLDPVKNKNLYVKYQLALMYLTEIYNQYYKGNQKRYIYE